MITGMSIIIDPPKDGTPDFVINGLPDSVDNNPEFQEFVDSFRSDAMFDISQREADNGPGIYISDHSEDGFEYAIGFRNVDAFKDRMSHRSVSYFVRSEVYSFRIIKDKFCVRSSHTYNYKIVTRDMLDGLVALRGRLASSYEKVIDIALIERDREIGMNHLIYHIPDKELSKIYSRCYGKYGGEGANNDV